METSNNRTLLIPIRQSLHVATENMTMGNEVYKVAPQNGSARFLLSASIIIM